MQGFDKKFWTICHKCKKEQPVERLMWNPDTWQPSCKEDCQDVVR